MGRSISAACNTKYKARKSSGTRPDSAVKWVVLHDTEGGTAESIARYFASSAAGGSAHLVVDDDDCYRCLTNSQVPWGAHGANYHGFHIEQCGYARWDTATWLKHIRTLRRAAYKTALHCKRFGIPVRYVDHRGLQAGKSGITTHAECSKAFPPNDGHHDPGTGWPRAVFMGMVRAYRLGMR